MNNSGRKVKLKIIIQGLLKYYGNIWKTDISVFSLELTTAETLEALVKTGFKKDGSYNQLKTVLTGADLVNLQNISLNRQKMNLHFQNSWDFVLETKDR